MARRYFRLKSQELRHLFEHSRSDASVLQEILNELKLRSTPKAVALRKEVEECLTCVVTRATGNSPSSDSRDTQDSELKEENAVVSTTGPAKKPNVVHSGGCGDVHEEVPDALSHDFHLVEPIGQAVGHPPKRIFHLKDDVRLPAAQDTPLHELYAQALRLLIDEMKRKGAGLRTIRLENGNAVFLEGDQKAYHFDHDGTVDLFEGAAVIAHIGGTTSSGFIVAVMHGSLIVALKDDFGDQIAVCVLSVDNTAMLEALAKRLDSLGEGETAGFNGIIAQAAVTGRVTAARQPAITGAKITEQLNKSQQAAVTTSLENDISYIWGPPGTGKTRCLTELARILLGKQKRILICSNTNQAVDQVLLQLCDAMGASDPAIESGAIIRIGRIANERLDQEWSSYVTIPGIVDRKSKELRERLTELEENVRPIRQMIGEIDRVCALLDKLDAARREKKLLAGQSAAAQESLKRAEQAAKKLTESLGVLDGELEQLQSAGWFRRALMRSEKTIRQDCQRVTRQKSQTEAKIESLRRSSLDGQVADQKLLHRIAALEKQVPAEVGSRKSIESRKRELEGKLEPLLGEIATIRRKLADMEAAVVREAWIIGATVTKTYLSPKQFSGFHIVIIDEASMVMLPALYYAAGLAKERVVISGDFRQLPPIVQTDQRELFQVIGRDIFGATGLTDAVQNGGSPPLLVMLDTQYRMQQPICDLISSTMYHARLKTQREQLSAGERPPDPFDQTLTVVDTSRIWPFVNRDAFGSRYNLMHALAIRNLCLYLHENGFVLGLGDVGIVTPYAAQAKLLRQILKGMGLEGSIASGTIHRFQGDEKRLVILDIPDSLGEATVGVFLEADNPEDKGAPLLNVGISRAKDYLVVFANLTYLQDKLPDHAFLRDVLYSMQTQGKIVDVHDVLSLRPVLDDLKQLQKHAKLALNLEETGLFRRKEFEAVCEIDIDDAKESIAVFSGFVTPQRVAAYGDLFRRKVAEGVTIRCVTRPPHANGSVAKEEGKRALDALECLGCVVDTRLGIHEKTVIIDDRIVWFGSLNMLSHTARTDEMMMRIDDANVAEQVALLMTVKRTPSGETGKGLSTRKENPQCPECSGRTFYARGRYGPFWHCEECNWHDNVDKPRRRTKSRSTHETAGQRQLRGFPNCPKCGVPMVQRTGPHGPFYGCRNFPNCKETRSLKPVRRRRPGSHHAKSGAVNRGPV